MELVKQTKHCVTIELTTRELLLIRIALAEVTGYKSPYSEGRKERQEELHMRLQSIDMNAMAT